MKFRIFYKFLIAISLLTLFPLIWLGSSLLEKSQEAVKTSAKEIHLNFIESVKNLFSSEVEKYYSVVKSLDRFFQNVSDWQLRQVVVNSFVKSYDGIESISIALKSGEEVLKISVDKDAELSKLSGKVLETALKNNFSVEFSTSFIKMVYYTDRYLVIFDIEPQYFYRKIMLRKIGSGSFFIFNKSSDLMYIDLQSQQGQDLITELVNAPLVKSLISTQASGVFETKLKGIYLLGAVSCYENTDVCFGSIQKRNDAYLYVDLAKRQAVFIIFFAAFISLIGSYLLSRMLSGPIVKFIEAAKRVSEKDFSVRVNVNTSDELEELRDTFNKMIEEIERYSNIQIERIIRERKNLEAVMYSTEDGMIMVDTAWNIQLINRKALSLTGVAESENLAVGKNLFECTSKDSVRQALEYVKEGKNKIEFKIERSGAVEYYRIETRNIVMKEEQDIYGILLTFYDITYDKQIEKLKDDFLHSITHDLRNPVSAIKGFSEFLLKEIAGPINQNQKNMIISIDRAAFRLLQMINNILDIAKMEAGKMELSLSRFNVIELINRCIDLMRILGEKKNIKFVLESPQELLITADAGLIERMYINLIGNAIKFTPQDGVITVGVSTEGDMFKSWVEDTGEGIPLEYVDKVFEKFEQVKGQKAGGTGLGLTICKYIAESHGGKIWAEWRPNKGAKFVFSFPLNLKKDEFGRVVKG